MPVQRTACLRTAFHIAGQYVLCDGIDDDGSKYSYPRWQPGVDHQPGEQFNVHRVAAAAGIHGIGDGIMVALCYRELKPTTESSIGEGEILAIPMFLLEFKTPEDE